MSKRVEEVWDAHANSSTQVLIARDAVWRCSRIKINSGVIILKMSPWTLDLINDIISHNEIKNPKFGSQHGLKDQPRWTVELSRRQELDITRYADNDTTPSPFEQHEHVSIVSQSVMNSFSRRGGEYRFDPQESRWKKGDWLCHVTGMNLRQRLEMMKRRKFCPKKIKDLLEIVREIRSVNTTV
jgi:hypothetical protein